jgi:hypothetical protein
MKIALLLLTTAVMTVAADCAVAVPFRFKVIPMAMTAFNTGACRIGSVFAWNEPDGWHAMIECKGPATDDHFIYRFGLMNGGRLGVRQVTETDPSPPVGSYIIEKFETTPQR